MGVISTLSAGADEVPQPPAAAPEAADTVELRTPPPTLPWGARPAKLKLGSAGASGKALAAAGADGAAVEPGRDALEPVAEFAPKGWVTKKKSRKSSRTAILPPAPPGIKVLAEPLANAAPVNYFYSSAYQNAESDGSYANLVISKPVVAKEDYHSLAEISVHSPDGEQIVEVGWTVDPAMHGDNEPHLFVYHWVDQKETCYNACGFVPYSETAVAGMKLPVDVSKKFGIRYYGGAWWIAYDSEYVGYFPDKLWDGRFTKSGLVQWFGEVASSRAEPCSEMGNGYWADDARSARVGSVSFVNGPDPVITVKADDRYYTADRLSDRTMRFGGPGAC